MNTAMRIAGIVLLLAISACSTVIEGPTQKIAVDSFPSGADCVIKDNDLILARVHTPGTAVIDKSKNDILVECNKAGYITNKKRNKSDVAISRMANMVMGQWSFIGNAVDSASGASHKYDSKVFMALNALPPVAQISADGPASAVSAVTVQPGDLSALPPEQLAQQIAHMLGTQKVIISHHSAGEVIHLLSTHQTVTGEAVQADPQRIAGLANPIPIQHSAE